MRSSHRHVSPLSLPARSWSPDSYVPRQGTLALTPPAAELHDNMSLLQASYLGEANGGVATTERSSP